MAQPKQCLSKASPHSPVFKYIFASLYLRWVFTLIRKEQVILFGSLQRWQRSFTSPRCAQGSSCGCSRVETSPSWISSLAGISYAAPFLNKCREQTAVPVQHLSEALWPRCRRPDAAQEREPTFVLPPFRQTLFVSNTQPRSVPTKGLGAFGVFFTNKLLLKLYFERGKI